MDKIKLAQRTIALLSSMIESGECHTARTKEMKDNALNGLEQLSVHGVSNCGGVNRTERGWAGHFICGHRCLFTRNTLLTYNDIKIVVSSVGLMMMDYNNERKFETIGHNRNFETMAFHADKNDKRYYDADVSKQIEFDNNWCIVEQDADDKANEMHEAVVLEISEKLLKGYKFEVSG